jgi:hypothetical protein
MIFFPCIPTRAVPSSAGALTKVPLLVLLGGGTFKTTKNQVNMGPGPGLVTFPSFFFWREGSALDLGLKTFKLFFR